MTARPTTETHRTQYLSIGEAAARYNVSGAYIRRRIIRIRTTDLEHLFRPVRSSRLKAP